MSADNPDEGWDDAPDAGGGEPADTAASPEGGAPQGGERRRRRRRRRPREGDDRGPQQAGGEPHHAGGGEAPQHREPRSTDRPAQPGGQPPQRGARPEDRSPRPSGGEAQPPRGPRPEARAPQQARQPGGREPQPGGREPRRDQPARGRGRERRRERDQRDRDAMRAAQTQESGGRHRGSRGHGDAGHGEAAGTLDELERHDDSLQAETTAVAPHTSARVEVARGSQPAIARDSESELDEAPAEAGGAWGTDDGAPAPAITLAADLPAEPPADDPDPVTWPLVAGPGAQLGSDVATVVGVRFVPAGRISWCDAGDADYAPGERVVVDSDRGPRLAWIATAPQRKPTRDRGMRRVMRRAHEGDLKGERTGEAEVTALLRLAKDKAAALGLPLKVFRVEKTSGKLLVYYTSDDRLDLRDFVRDVGGASGVRVELRQLGVRDEAKVVGGIGSCGLTLCCTTWLPDFVPVSIKMAKDQGLVLSPTKVSGQCGRLKCCLVYEQAGYAELRKGLPKLGKRVIGARGEGRVVEVDVLRQRVRVSYGPGDTEVVPASEVKPLFPSGNQPAPHHHADEPETEDEA